ncbi:galactosylgalactosylxylosylprotein 3-beta-glucuronosyltransferase I isoform X2 [Zootermopsis nevadensis]|uniref:galactosylgalactosylxylosylprotein 3-beta-glucuronosyltransferase I isoform X2 n=1 Tax=Zootermopsis nevadensis TaxID=136037 RepID=UPI000B8E6506|nr:galactosylgalactosylxylosylprotein 3-beta-glucuronosyltransferase I isoform X2 [Zootermopsis nevadensis]
MLQEIKQNNLNLTVSSQEMGMKRRLLLVLTIVIVIIWFTSLRNRGTIGLSESVSSELEIAALKQNLAKLSSECRSWKPSRLDPHLPVIYAITPTYARPVQKAELTRLLHTLMLVPNLHWIIIEDAEVPSSLVANLLKNSGITYTHLTATTPKEWKLKEKESNWKKPRGVQQRNTALQWIRNNLKADDQGVIYFADDDNSYSLEMRDTQVVSVWPVGLAGGLMVEMPVLDPKTGHVKGWNSAWRPERPFPLDMAGFAINLSHFLKHTEAKFSFNVENGYQESEILRHLATRDQLEPKADNCTKVYVWHTRTEAPKLQAEKQLNKKGLKSHGGIEV